MFQLLDVLENYCMAEGLDYSRLDGATKSKERVKIVKDFNSCPHTNLCLVSTMSVYRPPTTSTIVLNIPNMFLFIVFYIGILGI